MHPVFSLRQGHLEMIPVAPNGQTATPGRSHQLRHSGAVVRPDNSKQLLSWQWGHGLDMDGHGAWRICRDWRPSVGVNLPFVDRQAFLWGNSSWRVKILRVFILMRFFQPCAFLDQLLDAMRTITSTLASSETKSRLQDAKVQTYEQVLSLTHVHAPQVTHGDFPHIFPLRLEVRRNNCAKQTLGWCRWCSSILLLHHHHHHHHDHHHHCSSSFAIIVSHHQHIIIAVIIIIIISSSSSPSPLSSSWSTTTTPAAAATATTTTTSHIQARLKFNSDGTPRYEARPDSSGCWTCCRTSRPLARFGEQRCIDSGFQHQHASTSSQSWGRSWHGDPQVIIESPRVSIQKTTNIYIYIYTKMV